MIALRNQIWNDIYNLSLYPQARPHMQSCYWCKRAQALLRGTTEPTDDEIGMIEAHLAAMLCLYSSQVNA